MSTVIKIENLYKEYRLGVISHGTLYRDMQSWWANVRGKEDPNTLIGHIANEKNREQILALNDISLEVQHGEVLGIIGANGAGKSTLLKILSRVTAPTRGSIKIKGRIASLLEVGTGFHTELTGRENIYLNGAINGMNRKEVSKKIDEIVDFAGIGNFLDTPVKRYSSGMHVRLGFAVAAHLEPEILVVDEVLAVGDASFQKKAIGKMQDVSQMEGRTVLFVSHNMESIRALCGRGILLQNGKAINDGAVEDVINCYLASSEIEATGPELSFEILPDNDYQILRFGILDDNGQKSDYLDRTKPSKIFIDYVLRMPPKDLYIEFHIVTANEQNGVRIGTSVLGWSEKHNRRYKYGDEKIGQTPGKYRATINMPGYVLNSGKYKLSVTMKNDNYWYEKNSAGVLFSLYDEYSSHAFEVGRRSGLLAMPLDWNRQQL